MKLHFLYKFATLNKSKTMNTIEVCFTPVLFEHILTKDNYAVAVIDVLRATTSICTAFEYGVEKIIPVASDEEAIAKKKDNFLIAAEEDGITLYYADFGNSPFFFKNPYLKGKQIVYKTTNGTKAIRLAKNSNKIIIASFLNISAVANWFEKENLNAVLLCAGWKDKFNIEDTLLAGAIAQKLSILPNFKIECDSANAAIDLWVKASENPVEYIQKAMHRERLRKLGLDDVIEYCFTNDTTSIVPEYNGKEIIRSLRFEV